MLLLTSMSINAQSEFKKFTYITPYLTDLIFENGKDWNLGIASLPEPKKSDQWKLEVGEKKKVLRKLLEQNLVKRLKNN